MEFVPRLLISWAINLAALWAANAIWDGVQIHGWAGYLIGSAVLGVANAVLKRFADRVLAFNVSASRLRGGAFVTNDSSK